MYVLETKIAYLIWNSKILDCITTNVAFRHSPKPISVLHSTQTIITKTPTL